MSLHLDSFRHDVRLMYQLRSYELRHFLILLDYASDRRDPTFIPAKKREEVRLIMGFGNGDKSRDKFDARLARFEELDLIEIGQSGSILISFTYDKQIEEDEDDGMSPVASPTNSTLPVPSGQERRQQPERRQKGRVYSMSDDAQRQRLSRASRAEPQVVVPAPNVTENVTAIPESVTALESKRHAVEPQHAAETSQQNVTKARDVSALPLAGVSPNVNVSGEDDYKIISDSGDVSNVAAKTSQTEMSQNVTASSGSDVTASSGGNGAAPGEKPARVLLRPGFEDVDWQAQMMRDVEKAVGLAQDRKSRGFYIAVWKHCYAAGALTCWDAAVQILTSKITSEARIGPPPGQPGHFPVSAYGKSLNATLMNLLRDNGTPFEQGSASEREDVQRQIRESMEASSPEAEEAE